MDKQNNEQVTPANRMAQLEKVLDEYESKLGLPIFAEDNRQSEVEEYLSLERRQMEKLTIEDCAEIAIVLDAFAFHLQRAVNRENARVSWADNVLKEYTSGKESQYSGSWESQFYQAIKSDSYARGVLKIKNYAQQRSDRITYLANAIRTRGTLFTNLQKAKATR